jgi:hypothetical protein
MITRETVAGIIVSHLNGTMTEAELVRWAEDAFVSLSESESDTQNEDMLLDILGYIGAGDAPGFPLSWSVLSGFLEQLGVKVRVITEAT